MVDREAPYNYVEHAACHISGWTVVDGQMHSAPQPPHWSFWLDGDGKPHIGNPDEPIPDTALAVSGFGALVIDGELATEPGGRRAPRTAVGLDQAKRTLTLVVVEGRFPGYSEGMRYHELAKLMHELGCHDAIAFDGGGSSVMLKQDDDDAHQVMNRSAHPTGLRPVPVLFGVRRVP